MMKHLFMLFFILFLGTNLYADDLHVPPELLWWIYEVKKINPNIDINKFTFSYSKTIKFNGDIYQRQLTYPVFMRWNYSGNTVAYYDYYKTQPKRLPSGKYAIGGDFDDNSNLLIGDRNGKIIFGTDFGLWIGLDAIAWLTDTILIGVGSSININELPDDITDRTTDEPSIDLIIIKYKINHNNKTIEETFYTYKKAFSNEKRLKSKLNWYEQRTDYFEIR